jgi:hypothetical protein
MADPVNASIVEHFQKMALYQHLCHQPQSSDVG